MTFATRQVTFACLTPKSRCGRGVAGVIALLCGLAVVHGAETQTTLASPLPSFRYHGVVLEASQLKYRPHDDVIYPSVVRAEGRISKPPGNFLMYYAPHDVPGGICLAYADQPEGP